MRHRPVMGRLCDDDDDDGGGGEGQRSESKKGREGEGGARYESSSFFHSSIKFSGGCSFQKFKNVP